MNSNTTPEAQEAERVYNYIVAFFRDNHYSPRIRDIHDDLGIGENRVRRLLAALRAAGRICAGSTLPTIYTREALPPAA